LLFCNQFYSNYLKGTAKTKRPSRRYRRRPRDLLSSYTNRQRKIQWLKTHIWHAKRFHMNTLWNYRLADKSNTKSSRPTYKSLRERCLIHVKVFHFEIIPIEIYLGYVLLRMY
jgi:hypothetical protein